MVRLISIHLNEKENIIMLTLVLTNTMKKVKTIGYVVVALVIIGQFFRPEKNSGDESSLTSFYSETQPSNEVQGILKKACLDCHSNTTHYPWYASITPINYWLKHHIDEGKEELNFSEWTTYSVKRKKHKMEEIAEEIEENEMPLSSYLITHTEAKLTDEETTLIVNWAKEQYGKY